MSTSLACERSAWLTLEGLNHSPRSYLRERVCPERSRRYRGSPRAQRWTEMDQDGQESMRRAEEMLPPLLPRPPVPVCTLGETLGATGSGRPTGWRRSGRSVDTGSEAGSQTPSTCARMARVSLTGIGSSPATMSLSMRIVKTSAAIRHGAAKALYWIMRGQSVDARGRNR